MNDLLSAIIVFELIRDFYPGNFNRYGDNSVLKDQFNIYSVLGDTYLAAGQNEKAVECFKKALELNPNYSGAIQALKKLETGNQECCFKGMYANCWTRHPLKEEGL